jgi:hypothetical protein
MASEVDGGHSVPGLFGYELALGILQGSGVPQMHQRVALSSFSLTVIAVRAGVEDDTNSIV